jgi:RNA polymerase sigma-70 factor (ECF subfamily)
LSVRGKVSGLVNPSEHKRLTGQEILRQFYTDHNNEWLGPLLERYTLLLYGVSMKYLKNPEESRDAVQQIFQSYYGIAQIRG